MSKGFFNLLVTNKIVNSHMFENLDVDSALDQRDSDPFDSEWIRVYEKLQSISEKATSDNEAIRKLAFEKALEFSSGGEVAEYISDDFGLMYDALVCGYNDPWLSGLAHCYSKSRFPFGSIEKSEETLVEIFDLASQQ